MMGNRGNQGGMMMGINGGGMMMGNNGGMMMGNQGVMMGGGNQMMRNNMMGGGNPMMGNQMMGQQSGMMGGNGQMMGNVPQQGMAMGKANNPSTDQSDNGSVMSVMRKKIREAEEAPLDELQAPKPPEPPSAPPPLPPTPPNGAGKSILPPLPGVGGRPLPKPLPDWSEITTQQPRMTRKQKKQREEEERRKEEFGADSLSFAPRKKQRHDGEEVDALTAEQKPLPLDDAEENAMNYGMRGKMTREQIKQQEVMVENRRLQKQMQDERKMEELLQQSENGALELVGETASSVPAPVLEKAQKCHLHQKFRIGCGYCLRYCLHVFSIFFCG